MKFLNDRYMKGKERINTFMQEDHRLVCHDNLTMAHASIVEMQASMGSNGFLDLQTPVSVSFSLLVEETCQFK